jgi:hypothetical protein
VKLGLQQARSALDWPILVVTGRAGLGLGRGQPGDDVRRWSGGGRGAGRRVPAGGTGGADGWDGSEQQRQGGRFLGAGDGHGAADEAGRPWNEATRRTVRTKRTGRSRRS